MSSVFFNKGENCIAAGRLFVEEAIHDEFVKRVVEECKKMVGEQYPFLLGMTGNYLLKASQSIPSSLSLSSVNSQLEISLNFLCHLFCELYVYSRPYKDCLLFSTVIIVNSQFIMGSYLPKTLFKDTKICIILMLCLKWRYRLYQTEQ